MKRYIKNSVKSIDSESDDTLWQIVNDESVRPDTLIQLAMDSSVDEAVRIAAIRNPNMPQETRDELAISKDFQGRGTEFEVTFLTYGMMWDPDAVYDTAINIIKSHRYKYYKSDIYQDEVDNDQYVLYISCNLVTKQSDLDNIIDDFKNIQNIGITVLGVDIYDDVRIK